jgi:LysR family transcriptional regulator, nitrogen assimilation regulatory protein
MDFDLLQLFVDICDLGSFGKAAARHIVSQSAVSQRIAQLERRLGQSLFDRKARPLTLTAAGQIVYDSARQLLSIQAQMRAHLEDLQPMLSGPVRLGCIFSLALGPLRQMLRQFLRDAASVELHVTHGETYELAQDVLNGLIDLALVAYGEKSEGIQIEEVGKEPMILVVPPNLKSVPSLPVPGTWMNHRHLVTFPHHSPTRRGIAEAFAKIQVTPDIVLEVANPVVLIEAVAAGRGCAMMPFSSAVGALEQGEIVYVPCPDLEFERPICLMLHRRRPRTRATRALADFLGRQLSTLQDTWKGLLEKVALVHR